MCRMVWRDFGGIDDGTATPVRMFTSYSKGDGRMNAKDAQG